MTKYGIAFFKTNYCEIDDIYYYVGLDGDDIYGKCSIALDFLEKPKGGLLKMMNVSIKFCNTESRLTCLTH